MTTQQDSVDVEREAAFLCARLREFEREGMTEENFREWNGHVSPSLSRLEGILAALSLPITQRDEQGDGWQDIASAPYEGCIIGFMQNRIEQGEPYMAVIWWDDQLRQEGWNDDQDTPEFVGGWSAGRVDSFGYEEIAEEHPTHWQPMPAPPSIKQGDQDGGTSA